MGTQDSLELELGLVKLVLMAEMVAPVSIRQEIFWPKIFVLKYINSVSVMMFKVSILLFLGLMGVEGGHGKL